MNLFQLSFFKSKNDSIESQYQQGVGYLKTNDHYAADKCLRIAAAAGHVSAVYNLSILHGSGAMSPYDLDFAAKCYYEAAKLGHPSAVENIFKLEGADRGGFGFDNLAHLAATTPPQGGFNSLLMICAARFCSAVLKLHDASDEVIAIELKGASSSEYPSILNFVERCGVPPSFYHDAHRSIQEGSAADLITDGLNNFSRALRTAGNSEMICIAARCTILGYLISKTSHGASSEPLLGLDKFFKQ